MEVKINVSQSKVSEDLIKKAEGMSAIESYKFLHIISSLSGVTSPDFNKIEDGGFYRATKQPRKSFDLFLAIKHGRLTREINQRRGYKSFVFTF